MKKPLILVALLIFSGFVFYLRVVKPNAVNLIKLLPENFIQKFSAPIPTSTPVPTPTPTPKPLTFAEMNALYGPCVYLPTLMYHHVQDMDVARGKNQQNLTVPTETFRQQMQDLKDRGYQTASIVQLASFFDEGVAIPKKSILLTFDDAYEDVYLNAFPILKEFGFKATVFTPTGLVNNYDYLNWNQVSEMAVYGITFANHTWSHKNVKTDKSTLEMEIATADTQLSERGYNSPKSFAYPYGLESAQAIKLLQDLNYRLAFSTRAGGTLCKKQRFDLPRIRIGGGNIFNYGF
jgi:peptidoglycan/xylan/chitin deacetylase (PgdA/CDA1 family)